MGFLINPYQLASAGTAYPLDILPAYFGYGFNKLKSDFSGNVVRLQKMTSNTQQDFGLSGESIDQAAVDSWRSGEDVRVVSYYDQTGNGRHSTITTAASTGDGLVLSNVWQSLGSKVAALRNGGQYVAASWGPPSSLVGGTYYVGTITADSMLSSEATGSGDFDALANVTGTASAFAATGANPSYRNKGVFAGTALSRQALYAALGVNSAFILSVYNFPYTRYSAYRLGGRTFIWTGKFQSAILWDADLTAHLSNIDSSLNNYFGHY